jgi:hypothetical protein
MLERCNIAGQAYVRYIITLIFRKYTLKIIIETNSYMNNASVGFTHAENDARFI